MRTARRLLSSAVKRLMLDINIEVYGEQFMNDYFFEK